MNLSPLQAAAARIRTRSSKTGVLVGGRVALSALRARLDEASEGVDWLVNPDGVIGRALMMPAGATVTFGLGLANEVAFSARALLLPHDWRDRHGEVRASVSVTGPDGSARELWSATLRAADRGRPRGLPVHCQIPACATSLQLRIQTPPSPQPAALTPRPQQPAPLTPRSHQSAPVTRAIWVDPTITDPHAPPLPPAPASAPPPPPAVQTPGPSPGPLISVLTPVHDPPLRMLEEAIASVRTQTFTNWELCLVDDGSTNPEIIAALEHHAAQDPRIHLARRDTAGGISTATNTALELATGQYIALLDHDDTLTPDALAHVADQITTQPDLDMIYSDEDTVLDGKLIWMHPKPGWSPDTLRTNGYTCHLGVYRRELVSEIGCFRTEFNGSQDVDMILRLVERTDRVAHIPRVLYHWRAHAASTAGGYQAKPYAYVAARNAIAAHLERSGLEADVRYGPPGLYRVVHRVSPSTSVDLVLAVADERGLAEAAASWLAQPHPTWNLVLAAPADALDAATTALTNAGIPDSRITTIPTSPQDDPATALAAAADAATAEHLLLMQTPAMGLTHDWLTRLLGYSHQADIAAAGPILLAPDGRIQQAGIAIPQGIPLHLRHGSPAAAAPPVVFNLSAVSGVLATPRTTYQQLGGLHPQHHDLALIDYCLRATDTHQRTVIVPDARLRTTTPDTTTNHLPTLWQLRNTWAQTHTHDPYYNPNYRTDRGDFILR
jgi:O-antigen biosynthesis protein